MRLRGFRSLCRDVEKSSGGDGGDYGGHGGGDAVKLRLMYVLLALTVGMAGCGKPKPSWQQKVHDWDIADAARLDQIDTIRHCETFYIQHEDEGIVAFAARTGLDNPAMHLHKACIIFRKKVQPPMSNEAGVDSRLLPATDNCDECWFEGGHFDWSVGPPQKILPKRKP